METQTQENDPNGSPRPSNEPAAVLQELRGHSIWKRAMDIAIALPVVLFVLPPLMLVITTLHAFVSRGPLFFCQERIGRHGSVFSILKFRTMTPVSQIDSELEADVESRVYRFGHLVRLSKIDEIPQFVNVLRGEMSVVGPRPHHVQDCIEFQARVAGYRQRHSVKPGITGLAQIREYAGEFQWNCTGSRVAADIEYIQTRSLSGDSLLVFRTFSTVLWKSHKYLLSYVIQAGISDTEPALPFKAADTKPIDDAVEARREAA